MVLAALVLACAVSGLAQPATHEVVGIPGKNFTLTAKDGYVSTADGNSVYFWGYANGGEAAQYVGPTLIVNQGETVVVTLKNELPVATSIVFPGQANVTNLGGASGLITREAPAKIGAGAPGTVTYSFVASQPGTYQYHSGTRPDLQVEMGLVGALIVRPIGFNAATATGRRAYAHADSQYDLEYLFLLSEMDETIHDAMEVQVDAYKASSPTVALNPVVDMSARYAVYWFINGRTGPDTVQDANVSWLPAQPYDAMPIFNPGQKVLMRVVGGGRDAHPFHHHGNHARIIARDGRLLERAPGQGANLSQMVFTIQSTPGGTIDALFSWTGEKLGWDAYGHQSDVDNPPLTWNVVSPAVPVKGVEDVDWNGNRIYEATAPSPGEYAADHGKPFPVKLPTDQDLTFGQMYSGSPFLGAVGNLPPGEGGFNPGGFMYMWHSHNEKEIVNNNIFPGGMLTLVLIIP